MISCKDFHTICRKYGMIQCGITNMYMLPGRNDGADSIWYGAYDDCSLNELMCNGETFRWRYHIKDITDFEVAVKRTVELAKKLSVKIRMKKLNEDFK